MIKINDVEIERTPIGWLVDYPSDVVGIRFPLNMPLKQVMFSVLCSLARIELCKMDPVRRGDKNIFFCPLD